MFYWWDIAFNKLIQLGMLQSFEHLAKILTLKTEEISKYNYQFEGHPQHHLEKFLLAFVAKENPEKQMEVYSRFLNYMSDQRHCKLLPEYFSDLSHVKVLALSESKAFTFEEGSRAYCLYGRAVSTLKRKVKQGETERSYLCSQIENTVFQLFQDNNFHLSKNESHQIEDVLLNFSVAEDNLDPVLLSSEVFSPFVPQSFALVLILPIPLPRPDHMLSFLKATLLHVYIEQANLMHKIASREVFYKHTLIKGIYFIEQGEVESTGGRVIARGWATNGTCKSEGYGWKFKVLPFLKSIAKNEQIWKQFLNDLTLNKEYPFKLSYILGIREELDIYEIPDKRGGKKGIKLPKLNHRSFDYGKLIQIEKMKHYDDRISQICDYKEKLFTKKSGHSHNRNVTSLVVSEDEKLPRRLAQLSQSHSKQLIKQSSANLPTSHQNILIMSVLKKLQSLTEPKTYFPDDYKEKRDKIKISPAKLYEKSRIMKKKRYNK